MDAFSYFLTSLAALNFLIALLALLLGLLLGWLIWAKYKKLYENKPTCNCASEINHLKQELKKSDNALAACVETNDFLEAELKGSDAQLTEQSLPFITEPAQEETATKEPAAKSYFSSAIASGLVKEDDQYGLIYTQAPDDVDDLARIKGVAGVLSKTLNDLGVYKYRQIALWTPEICNDFSDKLSFKGRVERDDWVGQCKQFHEDKYGEQI